MMTLSRRAFAAVVVSVGVVSGLVGALVALAIDSPAEPQVVMVDRLVEVPAAEPPASPSEDEIELLVAEYLRLTSETTDDPFAYSLVEEIAANVCEFATSADEMYTDWSSEIELSVAEFGDFYDAIDEVCPAE